MQEHLQARVNIHQDVLKCWQANIKRTFGIFFKRINRLLSNVPINAKLGELIKCLVYLYLKSIRKLAKKIKIPVLSEFTGLGYRLRNCREVAQFAWLKISPQTELTQMVMHTRHTGSIAHTCPVDVTVSWHWKFNWAMSAAGRLEAGNKTALCYLPSN